MTIEFSRTRSKATGIKFRYIEKIKDSLPELPDSKKHRFMKEYGLSLYDAEVLSSDREISSLL
jgi:aspartyl-tRNA(Asn)/glutamyl-tRNA(Gln) amidotransferase subunit B